MIFIGQACAENFIDVADFTNFSLGNPVLTTN